jgi:plastocyanin
MTRLATVILAVAAWGGGLGRASFDLSGTAEVRGKIVADAVVWLDAPSAPRSAHAAEPVLDQTNLQFSPHVLAVEVGTTVKFPNDDRVFHNVFSTHDATTFNLGLYPVGMVKEIPFNKPGLSRIFCSIHPQMAAYVMVVDTPYFAVSDAAGHFVIRGVPSAMYHYHAWRPGGPILNSQFEVGSATVLTVDWP